MSTNYKRPRKIVYKRDSIMLYFPGKKEKTLKYASKILSDKGKWCNKRE